MVPLQYIIHFSELQAALASGCSWIQTTDVPDASAVQMAHDGGSYLFVTDNVEACKTIAADGVLLTSEAIETLASEVPEPTGIVLQKPHPITIAIAEARKTLGEETPQMIGVVATTPSEAVDAAKAGADFIQVPKDDAIMLLNAVRERSFTTPIVSLEVQDVAETIALLGAGINGIACSMEDVPPILIPSLLNADE